MTFNTDKVKNENVLQINKSIYYPISNSINIFIITLNLVSIKIPLHLYVLLYVIRYYRYTWRFFYLLYLIYLKGFIKIRILKWSILIRRTRQIKPSWYCFSKLTFQENTWISVRVTSDVWSGSAPSPWGPRRELRQNSVDE